MMMMMIYYIRYGPYGITARDIFSLPFFSIFIIPFVSYTQYRYMLVGVFNEQIHHDELINYCQITAVSYCYACIALSSMQGEEDPVFSLHPATWSIYGRGGRSGRGPSLHHKYY